MSNGKQTPSADPSVKEEFYLPRDSYMKVQVPRGQQRYDCITVGSWWVPKTSKANPEAPGEALRIESVIPSMPMNKVKLSRVRQPVITVNALVNGWDPVKPKPGLVAYRREIKRPEKESKSSRLDRLEEEVKSLRADLNALRADLDALMAELGAK